MAIHDPITAAPAAAPAFPNLDPLDNLSARLEALEGAAGVIATALDGADVGTDIPKAAYALAYGIEDAQAVLSTVHEALLAYRTAVIT